MMGGFDDSIVLGGKHPFPAYIVVWSVIGGVVAIVIIVSVVRAIYAWITNEPSEEEKLAAIRRHVLATAHWSDITESDLPISDQEKRYLIGHEEPGESDDDSLISVTNYDAIIHQTTAPNLDNGKTLPECSKDSSSPFPHIVFSGENEALISDS